MCYYLDDIIKLEDFALNNILMDGKSHENILIFDILYKTLIDPKRFWIIFDKIDGFTRIYDEKRYLTLFGSKNFDAIYDRVRYLRSLKSGITYSFSHYLAKIKVDFYDSLSIKRILALHNVILPIKSFLNKDKNQYYYKKKKFSYQLAKK